VFIAEMVLGRVRKVGTDGIITTVAGVFRLSLGEGGGGDGDPAVTVRLEPAAVAVDPSGNLFIAETNRHRVRKVTPDGIIHTVAGTGVPGFSGDGGPAVSAELFRPSSVTIDAAGNLFITDSWNYRIRNVDRNRVIHTVAGVGTAGYSGDEGAAILARLTPSDVAIAVDGSLLIADEANCHVRRVGLDGIIHTVAGASKCGFGGDGGRFWQNSTNHRVWPSIRMASCSLRIPAITASGEFRWTRRSPVSPSRVAAACR
jgi:hypothetical protein